MTWAALALPLLLAAQQFEPPPLPGDPRIQLVRYDPGQVVTLPVAVGYAAVVEFGLDERVDSVVVGNSAAWQVTASKRGDHVVVKPLADAALTDMVVVTGDRRYVFLLQPAEAGAAPFVLRFTYPTPITLEPRPAVESTYRFGGAARLRPSRMTDDGQRTTIQWPPDRPMPAVFAVGRNGKEALVNGRVVDGSYVVESVAQRFMFRLGSTRATADRLISLPAR